jgi:5-methylcytosine-specific restriction endonuclease McrA
MARRSHAGRSMTPEECARRLTAFLNRAPRSKKTYDYLRTLPKRGKVQVSPEEFTGLRPKSIAWKPEPIKARIIAKADGQEIASFVRKDRIRPRCKRRSDAAKALDIVIPEPPLTLPGRPFQPLPWNCRQGGRFHPERKTRAPKLIRSVGETMQQRILLYIAQEGRCGLCGEEMQGSALVFSLDHVIPRSLAGADGLGNLLLCHGECNGRKTNDAPTGCEMVWLLNVNSRLSVHPRVF